MRLGVNLTYRDAVAVAGEAERLGYDIALAPEGYRSDAATVLGAVATCTRRLALGPGVFQIPARTPAMTALTTATLDTLSEGRVRLGLGVSNPDISEGWHGVDFARPLARTREYVDIVRRALDGEAVVHDGKNYILPSREGSGAALKLHALPVQDRVPIYLAAVGKHNLRLAGEIADGWLATFCTPDLITEGRKEVEYGRKRAFLSPERFDVIAGVPTVVGDVEAASNVVRGFVAHFIGMGEASRNSYFAVAERLGHGRAATEIHERCAAGDLAGARAAVPVEFMDEISLLGPADRIADRMKDFAGAGADVLAVSPLARTTEGRLDTLRTVVEAAERAGVLSS